MRFIRQQFQVSYNYPVYFTKTLFSRENNVFGDFLRDHTASQPSKLLVVLDQGLLEATPGLINLMDTYFSSLQGIDFLSEKIMVPGGERAKNDESHLQKVIEAVDHHKIDRHSYLIAVGGGAVLDMAGYAAAISHRGIRHIRIPTTVLSQNDSGIGVKNSVNYAGKKNFLGTFTPPMAVFNDISFLKTLNDRDWRSGISEAIKVALIKDPVFFIWLEDHAEALSARNEEIMEELIYRCAQLHLDHIKNGDPFEFGSSRPLDFGHWSAHKLESMSHFSLRHGEAVAIGIALDSTYSYLNGHITAIELDRILNLFYKLGFTLHSTFLADANELLAGLHEFREHLGGRLTIMLLESLGKGQEVHEMNDTQIVEAVKFLSRHVPVVNQN